MARDEEEQPTRGFKVDDRRRFTGAESSGSEPAETRADEAAAQPRRDERREEPPPRDAAHDGGEAEHEAFLPEMTFSTFVMGLTTQALMHLGEIADPLRQEVGKDLPAAKQMIDLLAILREKTKGNLDAAEDQLLGDMLYDLRMRYVEVARGR